MTTTTQYEIKFAAGTEGTTLSHPEIEIDNIESTETADVYTVTVPAGWTRFEQMLDTDANVVSYREVAQ